MTLYARRADDPGALLAHRADALRGALQAGGDRLEPTAVRHANQVLGKVSGRLQLTDRYTVAALAGATGSGKSSLFNALAGAELSQVGVRRPTTSAVSAAVWGAGDAGALLDWLAVPARHYVPEAEPDGLVLLDLPDHDSTTAANRAEADRVLDLVDVFIWVTDPQKYADAVLHRGYLAPRAGHQTVTICVLNQIDRLSPAQQDACVADLRRLLAADGLDDVAVVPVSATTGQGLADLTARIARIVRDKTSLYHRLVADIADAAMKLSAGVGTGEPDPDRLDRQPQLLAALGGVAGAPIVLGAVQAQYRHDATAAVSWPFTRWLRRFRPDPLGRLGIRLPGASDRKSSAATAGPAPVRRTSLPRPSSAALTQLDAAGREWIGAATHGLPPRWADTIRRAANTADPGLRDALDVAVASTDLGLRRPLWWRVAGLLQWLFAACAAAGLIWLLVLMVLGWLKMPQPATPYLGPLPWPTVLLAGGAILGLGLAMALRPVVGVGAQRAGAHAAAELDRALAGVAQQRLLAPVRQTLEDHRRTRELLAAAQGRSPADQRQRTT